MTFQFVPSHFTSSHFTSFNVNKSYNICVSIFIFNFQENVICLAERINENGFYTIMVVLCSSNKNRQEINLFIHKMLLMYNVHGPSTWEVKISMILNRTFNINFAVIYKPITPLQLLDEFLELKIKDNNLRHRTTVNAVLVRTSFLEYGIYFRYFSYLL